MALELLLRPVTDQDRAFLRTLYGSTRTTELAQTGWTPENKKQFLDMQFKAQSMHYEKYFPAGVQQILLVNSVPAGRLYLNESPEEILIVDIVLLPEYRNLGIGSDLLGDIMTSARHTRKTVHIHVEFFNPAIQLYRRLGFREVEDQGVYKLMRFLPQKGVIPDG